VSAGVKAPRSMITRINGRPRATSPAAAGRMITNTRRSPRAKVRLKRSSSTRASICDSVGSTASETAIDTNPSGSWIKKVAFCIQVIASSTVREARLRSMMMPTFWTTMLSTTGA